MIIENINLEQDRILIAEIGNNHEGDIALAKDLTVAAIESGADAVKFQLITPKNLVHFSETDRITQLERFKIPLSTIIELAAYVKSQGKLFIASLFDLSFLQEKELMEHLAAIKIASGDIDFFPFLDMALDSDKPLILSTGASTIEEIEQTVNHIQTRTPDALTRLTLLHCVSLYPTPLMQANIKVIQNLKKRFRVTVGYSDHTLGLEASIMALSNGARVIEKHFTLNKDYSAFRDHALSADPNELKQLADVVHNFDSIMGPGDKTISDEEKKMAKAIRRSIVAARDLKAGSRLSLNDCSFVRPQTGLPPSSIHLLIGKTLKSDLKNHDLILEDHLE